MDESRKIVCPIPHLGYCIYERCNFWDEEKGECSGLCFAESPTTDGRDLLPMDQPCIIYWTEDTD